MIAYHLAVEQTMHARPMKRELAVPLLFRGGASPLSERNKVRT